MLNWRDCMRVFGFVVFLGVVSIFSPPGVTIKSNKGVGIVPTTVTSTLYLDPERIEYADVLLVCEEEALASSRHNAVDGYRWQVTFNVDEPCEYFLRIVGYNGKHEVARAQVMFTAQ